MKTRAAALIALLALLPWNEVSPAPPASGRIEKLEVNSVTRARAAAWLRVHLPSAATGSKQGFRGEVTLAGVPVPVAMPVTVMVQRAAAGFDAVFLLDLDLTRVSEALLSRVGLDAFDVALRGTLTGERASRAGVFAVGTLGTGGDIVARASDASTFIRFDGARLAGLSIKETRGEATVVLFNPLHVPVGIEEIRYSLFVEDRLVAEGVKRGIRLYPGRESSVQLPILSRNIDLLSAAGAAAMNGGSVAGRLSGRVVVKAGGGRRVIPVDLPGRVDLLK